MKLASLKNSLPDGTLVVVDRSMQYCCAVPDIAATLQAALDDWQHTAPLLEASYRELNQNPQGAKAFDPARCHAPLPRAYQWADGSAYVNHVELVRKARGAELPAELWHDPLMYQGGSDSFLGPQDPIRILDTQWGTDMEAEIAVITDRVQMGSSEQQAAEQICLLLLVNDVSLRNLIPAELAKGFGFFQSKPSSAFSPVAVTVDELGDAWQQGKIRLPLKVHLNDKLFGQPNAGEDMIFNFPRLIAHAAKTRDLAAGSIIGSGTVSNKQGGLHGSSVNNGGVGYCCIAEVRMYETIETGKPQTEFLQPGDVVRIEMLAANGESIFGAIEQQVELSNPV